MEELIGSMLQPMVQWLVDGGFVILYVKQAIGVTVFFLILMLYQGYRRPFLLLPMGIGIALPFLARLPMVPVHGFEYVGQYFLSPMATMMILPSSLLPVGFLVTALTIARWGDKPYRPYGWGILSGSAAYAIATLSTHAIIDLGSASTAAIIFLYTPFISFLFALTGYVAGGIAEWVYFRYKPTTAHENSNDDS